MVFSLYDVTVSACATRASITKEVSESEIIKSTSKINVKTKGCTKVPAEITEISTKIKINHARSMGGGLKT